MNSFKKLLESDNLFYGILSGLIIPVIGSAFFYLVNLAVVSLFNLAHGLKADGIIILGIALNIIFMRLAFLKNPLSKTAKGTLLVTFIALITLFAVAKRFNLLPEYF